MRKKARNLGLTNLLRTNELARKAVNSAMALPLLPQEHISAGLDSIVMFAEQNGIQDELQQFLNNVQCTWIEGIVIVSLCLN